MKPLPDDPPPIEALFGDRRPLPRTATLAELDKIVENSSEKNRNFFIAYLGLLIYVQAIVFSTTDLQLLVFSEGLKLPIIDLTVPLVGFYVVTPVFVIALHFNFLQNLESHHYKLMRWQEAHPDGTVPRSRIQPFLFDYATLETGSQLERWVRWANALLVLNLAPITLGLLLLRYTDRQDGLVTIWHFLAFVFDNYLVWKLRLAFDHNKSPNDPPPCRSFWLEIPQHGLRGVYGLFLILETALTLGTAWLPAEAFIACIWPFARATQTFNGDEDNRLASWVLPRIAIDPNEKVWTPDVKRLEIEAKLAGGTDWAKHFNQQGQGFLPSSPKPANLRLARLPYQNLPRAQLANAKLEGAYLWGAQLQAADLEYAQLQAAYLGGAQLQAAMLQKTALFGATPPTASGVWLGKPPFVDNAPDWKSLERLADGIPEGEHRAGFLERIKQAKARKNSPATRAAFTHDPGAVYREVLPSVCEWKDQAESRRAAVRGIRRNYQRWWMFAANDDPGLQTTLVEIDRTLCQNPACADLKADIEGLDCGQFDKAKPKK